MKIFVTGATGFIGSHIARALVADGHTVLALRRKPSNLSRCADFQDQIRWVDQDAADWRASVVAAQPAAILHAAWSGVTAAERTDWRLQKLNLDLFADLLEIAEKAGLQQFVALGSQAEYGPINGRVDENHPCRPDTAYGATKLACLALLAGFARQRKMTFVWLRLFSVYGPGESETWFIPSLIRRMKLGQSPELSGCEQRYDYLHVQDLAAGVLAVLKRPEISGVFNLGSNTSLPLKQVVNQIKELTGCPAAPGFGALPYRPGQSMHLEGDSTKFNQTFAFQPRIHIMEGLRQMVAGAASPADRTSNQ